MAYRILSFDGGGSWALLQALALQEIYKDRPQKNKCKEILDDFQLIVANSGGSLLLAAMIEKDTIEEVIELFLDENTRKSIFSSLTFFEKTSITKITNLLNFGPKYKASRKITGLRKVLEKYGTCDLKKIPALIGIKTKIMILSFDCDRQRAVYFRSFPSPNASSDENEVQLAEAVHASSNAPINYFDEPALFNYQGFQRRFWDGAVGGNNNPCLTGVIEALAEVGPAEIELRSIGTANVFLPIKGQTPYGFQYPFLVQEPDSQNLKNDIKKMASSILSEPPDAATYVSHIILGGSPENKAKPRVVRLNPLIQPFLRNEQWTLPNDFDPTIFKKLISLDMDAVKEDEMKHILYLGVRWIENKVKNQPIRMNMKDLSCQIGHDTFGKGKTDW